MQVGQITSDHCTSQVTFGRSVKLCANNALPAVASRGGGGRAESMVAYTGTQEPTSSATKVPAVWEATSAAVRKSRNHENAQFWYLRSSNRDFIIPIRSGKKQWRYQTDFLNNMITYFARKCHNDYDICSYDFPMIFLWNLTLARWTRAGTGNSTT